MCQFRSGQFRLVRSGQVMSVQVRFGRSGHISSGPVRSKQVGSVSSGIVKLGKIRSTRSVLVDHDRSCQVGSGQIRSVQLKLFRLCPFRTGNAAQFSSG